MDLTGGILSGIGGLISNLWTDSRQEDQQKFNSEQAQINRDFQERMSSTAWQRGMADMKAGGLNPILAYQKGPAGSPSGATAQTSFTPATDILSPAVGSALASSRNAAEVENLKQMNANLKATYGQTMADIALKDAQRSNVQADTAVKGEELGIREKGSAVAKKDQEFYESSVGSKLRMLGLGMREVNPLVGNVTPFMNRFRGD
jgi:hypothetical protein